MKYAALLRGINVGGNHMVPMPELVKMFERLECTGVCSYVNSGNIVFAAPAALAKKVPRAIAAAIDKKLAFTPEVVVRDARELAAIVKGNPFPRAEAKQLHVAFYAEAPDDITALAPAPDEKLVLRGRDLYLYMPRGVGQTKMKLRTAGTMRNWNTVQKLAELTS